MLGEARTLAPGATAEATQRLFAGAKEVATVDAYERTLGIKRFDLLIDWGWFYFITKPLFKVLDFFYQLFGNFGVAILIVTVLVKLLFFPLANKSYTSMAKMKAVQPEMAAIRERYADDKMKQQQALMDLYKKEKINPVAGCWPVLIQIPVFFALYKVLFVTIEMRHAPFFGWIRDLAAPDPTTVFNLFGLLPFDPTAVPVFGSFLHLGAWPHHHGRHDVAPDEDEPGAAGPGPEADVRLDAADLHLHAGELPGRPRDLLGLEQPAFGDAAIRHHEAERRQGGVVGQPARDVREKSAGQGIGPPSPAAPERCTFAQLLGLKNHHTAHPRAPTRVRRSRRLWRESPHGIPPAAWPKGLLKRRRGGRAVECTALEMRHTGNRIGGSNPPSPPANVLDILGFSGDALRSPITAAGQSVTPVSHEEADCAVHSQTWFSLAGSGPQDRLSRSVEILRCESRRPGLGESKGERH